MLLLAILCGAVAGSLAGLVGLTIYACLWPWPADDAFTLARVIAKADGLDFDEVCGHQAEKDGCDSRTCIACHFEDHDPDWARTVYLRRAQAVRAHLKGAA